MKFSYRCDTPSAAAFAFARRRIRGPIVLFVNVLDGKGHAAHASFPFKVELSAAR